MSAKHKSERAIELEYLLWFRIHADFGPDADAVARLDDQFRRETGKELPKGWDDE